MDEYEIRLQELQKVRIELLEDPVSSGLTSINRKIAELQGQKDRVSSLFLESIKNRAEAQILVDSKKGEYNRRLDELLATDPEVQNQKSEKLRISTANTKMAELVLEEHYAEKDYTQADVYYKCVQQVYNNLESANANLSRQISVIQMSLQIGEIRGDELKELTQGRRLKIKEDA